MKNRLTHILIDNFGFKNKGDQLMIKSSLEAIRLNMPEAKVFLRKSVFMQNPSFCMDNKIYPMEESNTGIRHSNLYKKIVNFLLRDEIIVTPNQIDVILDCCGYYITDAWHKNEGDYLYVKHYYSLFTNPHIKIYYLPQAFGPFRNEWSQKIAQFAYERATKIYPREEISYEYMKSACGKDDKLSVAPDFTCLCKPIDTPSIKLPAKQYVLVIPNGNMVGQTDDNTATAYIDSMAKIIFHIQSQNIPVYLLNHEGIDDDEILIQINNLLDKKVPIISNISGWDIKAIIKDAKLVISSRYHGVISALTQGVPTLCTSWSHKYVELLKEHKCNDSVLDVTDINSCIVKVQDAIDNPISYVSKFGCNEAIERMVKTMWRDIFNDIFKL